MTYNKPEVVKFVAAKAIQGTQKQSNLYNDAAFPHPQNAATPLAYEADE